jgi:catechol 2,3-dioxygenase-like lactoylglutathione lyase family enzyme
MAARLVDGLSVVVLLARDTKRTGAFYREVLDLPLIEEAHDGQEHDGRPPPYACRLGGYDFLQLGFTVADLDAFMERLEEKHITALHGPRDFEYTRYTTLLDPDGRHVRVMTPWQR